MSGPTPRAMSEWVCFSPLPNWGGSGNIGVPFALCLPHSLSQLLSVNYSDGERETEIRHGSQSFVIRGLHLHCLRRCRRPISCHVTHHQHPCSTGDPHNSTGNPHNSTTQQQPTTLSTNHPSSHLCTTPRNRGTTPSFNSPSRIISPSRHPTSGNSPTSLPTTGISSSSISSSGFSTTGHTTTRNSTSCRSTPGAACISTSSGSSSCSRHEVSVFGAVSNRTCSGPTLSASRSPCAEPRVRRPWTVSGSEWSREDVFYAEDGWKLALWMGSSQLDALDQEEISS
ncbi:hypothetical protein GBA52_027595 [Prunus armeniaca]|nr:hypothetical protein GBA52_027595 [Prunus armeniaca]